MGTGRPSWEAYGSGRLEPLPVRGALRPRTIGRQTLPFARCYRSQWHGPAPSRYLLEWVQFGRELVEHQWQVSVAGAKELGTVPGF